MADHALTTPLPIPQRSPIAERERSVLAALWRHADTLGTTRLAYADLREAALRAGLGDGLSPSVLGQILSVARSRLRARGWLVDDRCWRVVELTSPRPEGLAVTPIAPPDEPEPSGALISPRSILRGLTIRQRAALAELPAMLRQRIEGARA